MVIVVVTRRRVKKKGWECVAISRHERKDAGFRQTLYLIGVETCPCPEFIYGSTGTCGYNMRVGYAF